MISTFGFPEDDVISRRHQIHSTWPTYVTCCHLSVIVTFRSIMLYKSDVQVFGNTYRSQPGTHAPAHTHAHTHTHTTCADVPSQLVTSKGHLRELPHLLMRRLINNILFINWLQNCTYNRAILILPANCLLVDSDRLTPWLLTHTCWRRVYKPVYRTYIVIISGIH